MTFSNICMSWTKYMSVFPDNKVSKRKEGGCTIFGFHIKTQCGLDNYTQLNEKPWMQREHECDRSHWRAVSARAVNSSSCSPPRREWVCLFLWVWCVCVTLLLARQTSGDVLAAWTANRKCYVCQNSACGTQGRKIKLEVSLPNRMK